MWKIIVLLPCFGQTEEVKLMVDVQIMDEMSLARERADVEETEVDSSVSMVESRVSRPSRVG